jgi:hypothetical protein
LHSAAVSARRDLLRVSRSLDPSGAAIIVAGTVHIARRETRLKKRGKDA